MLGSISRFVYITHGHEEHHDVGTSSFSEGLNEDFFAVDLILKGTVLEQEPTFLQDAGIPNGGSFEFKVTPAKIKVNEVFYGSDTAKEITFLQHGAPEDEDNYNFVTVGKEVILILSQRADGKYWSYDSDSGVWNINNGKVTSKGKSKYLMEYKNLDLNKFIEAVTSAATNKKKNNNYLP